MNILQSEVVFHVWMMLTAKDILTIGRAMQANSVAARRMTLYAPPDDSKHAKEWQVTCEAAPEIRPGSCLYACDP